MFEQEKKDERIKQTIDFFFYMYIARRIKKDNRASSRYITKKKKFILRLLLFFAIDIYIYTKIEQKKKKMWPEITNVSLSLNSF